MKTLRWMLVAGIISTLCYALGAMSIAVAGATDSPINCTWTTDNTTSPSNNDTLGANIQGNTPALGDGTTTITGSCDGLEDNYSQIISMQNASGGGVEVLALYDADQTFGSGPTYATFNGNWSFDMNNGSTASDNTDPGAIGAVILAWFDNATDAESYYQCNTANDLTPGNACVTDSTGTNYVVTDSGSATDDDYTATTTTEPAAQLIADTATSEDPGLIALATGLLAICVITICVRMVFQTLKNRNPM